jgi:L-rhamnose mutarotase
MQRFAAVTRVHPEKLEQYKALHAKPWAGVHETLKKVGIHQGYAVAARARRVQRRVPRGLCRLWRVRRNRLPSDHRFARPRASPPLSATSGSCCGRAPRLCDQHSSGSNPLTSRPRSHRCTRPGRCSGRSSLLGLSRVQCGW